MYGLPKQALSPQTERSISEVVRAAVEELANQDPEASFQQLLRLVALLHDITKINPAFQMESFPRPPAEIAEPHSEAIPSEAQATGPGSRAVVMYDLCENPMRVAQVLEGYESPLPYVLLDLDGASAVVGVNGSHTVESAILWMNEVKNAVLSRVASEQVGAGEEGEIALPAGAKDGPNYYLTPSFAVAAKSSELSVQELRRLIHAGFVLIEKTGTGSLDSEPGVREFKEHMGRVYERIANASR